MFSYSRDFCMRSHRRYTMCGFHYNERHRGLDWRQCPACKDMNKSDPSYSENGYNVTPRLDRPKGECMCVRARGGAQQLTACARAPRYSTVKCAKCPNRIYTAQEGYSNSAQGGITCTRCSGGPR